MTVLGVLLVIWLLFGFQKMLCGNEKAFHVFDAKSTIPLRGLLAVMIVLHHFNTLYPQQYPWLNQAGFWGVPVCTLFFFFSGYGVTISYIKKGKAYLDHFLPKRLHKLLIPIIVVVIIHLFVLCLLDGFDTETIFEGILHGVLILPHLWFVCALIVFYCAFYISFRFLSSIWLSIIVMGLFTIGYITVINMLGWGTYWISSIHGFVLGIMMASIIRWVDVLFIRHRSAFVSCLPFFSILVLTYCLLGSLESFRLPAWGTLFYWQLPFIINLFSGLVRISQCRLLFLSGNLSFEIYLVHVSVMMLLHPIISNGGVYFIATFLLTLVYAGILHIAQTRSFLTQNS